MASKYWIKLYHEILDDPKMGRLTDRLFRRTIQLFLIAGDFDADGVLPTTEDMAWRLRMGVEELETDLADLASTGIVQNKNDRWVVSKFVDRQAASTGTERWRQWKERQRKENYYQTPDKHNANETLSDIDTDIDTDIDVDVDKEEEVNPDGIYTELSVAFCNKTKLLELSPSPDKWFKALKKMGEAGVEPQDIENAVDILWAKDYSIVGLSSVTNTAIGEMSKRVGKKPDQDSPEARRSYVEGKYADFIEH